MTVRSETEGCILGFLVRGPVAEVDLLDGLAAEFGIDRGQVALLEHEEGADHSVVVECYHRDRGFATDVTVYLNGKRFATRPNDLALASSLASRFRQDVLVAPPSSMGAIAHNPGKWLLFRPSGEAFLVRELDPGEGDDIVIDDDRPRWERIGVDDGFEAPQDDEVVIQR